MSSVWSFATGGSYVEQLEWLTDVLQSPHGARHPRRLRASPRTSLTLQSLERGASRRRMDAVLRAGSGGPWQFPVTVDTRHLSAPAAAAATSIALEVDDARFVAGGFALLAFGDPRRAEVVEIDTVGTSSLTLAAPLANDWPAMTEVVPLRRGRLAAMPNVGRFTADASDIVQIDAALHEPLDSPAAMPGASYRDLPVWDIAPVWLADPVWSPERLLQGVDYAVGTPVTVDTARLPLGHTQAQYAAVGLPALRTLRSALFALAGREGVCWVPSWTHDMRIVADVSGGAGHIDIEGPLLSPHALPDNRRDIRITLFDGTVLYRRITDVTAQSATVDRLTLDATLPAFTAGAVDMACFVALCAQEADVNVLRYFDATTLTTEITWREVAG